MRGLTDSEILNFWEGSQSLHPIDQALRLLRAALPELLFDELAAMPIGRRNAHLIELRARTLGHRWDCFASCTACGEELTFDLNLSGVARESLEAEVTEVNVDYGDLTLNLRPINSTDLAAIATMTDTDEACQCLVKRCSARTDVQNPEGLAAFVSDHLEKVDPLASTQIDLTCKSCQQTWSETLDVVEFFRNEICYLARQLLAQVHTLANLYGWSESDILAMSRQRRNAYLELAL